jgi:L-lactate dehydrogenase complex protein LldG
MSARANIIGRLRTAPTTPSITPILTNEVIEISAEALLQQFVDNVKQQRTEVIDIRKSSLRDALAMICATKKIQNLMIPPHDLPTLITWSGGPKIYRFNQSIELLKVNLFDIIDAGLTIADSAIADTGTLIHSDPNRMPRTLSLVPPIHICMLDVRHIYSNMQTALRSIEEIKQMPSNLIFITGPSKTSDIQQTLAYGAHGPRELILLLTEGL